VTIAAKLDNTPPANLKDRSFDIFQPERNNYLHLTISDTGIGMPPDQLEPIFEAFYQIDNTSTRQYSGSGLGLAIAKNYVNGHNGSIWVESKLGQGSTFHICLPYSPAPPPCEGEPMPLH